MWTPDLRSRLFKALPPVEECAPVDGEKRLVLWLTRFSLELVEAEAVVQEDYVGWYCLMGNAVHGYTSDDDCVIGTWPLQTLKELTEKWDWEGFPSVEGGAVERGDMGVITYGTAPCFVLKEDIATFRVGVCTPYREVLDVPCEDGFTDLYAWELDGHKIWWDHHYHPVHCDSEVVRAWCAL
jgi:hypothetical protein